MVLNALSEAGALRVSGRGDKNSDAVGTER